MDVQLLPVLKSQVWDSSTVLDDGSIFGGIVSSFTGYRVRPTLMALLIFGTYRLAILWTMRRQK